MRKTFDIPEGEKEEALKRPAEVKGKDACARLGEDHHMPLQPFPPDHCGTHSGPNIYLVKFSFSIPSLFSLNTLNVPLQFHLVKCRKNHAGSDLKVCPFNASHHVPAPEEEFHMKTCSDRKVKLDSRIFLLH